MISMLLLETVSIEVLSIKPNSFNLRVAFNPIRPINSSSFLLIGASGIGGIAGGLIGGLPPASPAVPAVWISFLARPLGG